MKLVPVTRKDNGHPVVFIDVLEFGLVVKYLVPYS